VMAQPGVTQARLHGAGAGADAANFPMRFCNAFVRNVPRLPTLGGAASWQLSEIHRPSIQPSHHGRTAAEHVPVNIAQAGEAPLC
jgi:hypothetical protein